ASDDLTAGQSTFMVEMSEVAKILKDATSNSLIILDEIGRGTSTFDGMSIAKAVAEYIINSKELGSKTLFATHYHELTSLEQELNGVVNYNIAVKKRGDDITFLRKIVKGGVDDSYGIAVAKLAGIPDSVIKRANVILKELESEKVGAIKNEQLKIDAHLDQIPSLSSSDEKVIKKLKDLSLDTLTPIEAMNMLYDLKQDLG
ncbi:MAG: DNA mismatch repair protein MutS, partial [Oscillospiraceae bacterium]|nr:DNA mismatch repair protein MutS [Oscillospiraceae bacterium]